MNKNKYAVFLTIIMSLLVMLSSCTTFSGNNDNASQEDIEQDNTPEATAPQENTDSSDDGIEFISFDEDIDFETKEYTDGLFSYEIPDGWKEFEEMASPGVSFFCKDDADLDLYPSNVVVEIVEVSSYTDDQSPYGEKDVYESFFEFVIDRVYSVKQGLTIVKLAVWEASERYIYIVDTDRALDDGTIVHQTNYYPMGFDGFITITATDFNDGLSPDINEIARHIALGITLD